MSAAALPFVMRGRMCPAGGFVCKALVLSDAWQHHTDSDAVRSGALATLNHDRGAAYDSDDVRCRQRLLIAGSERHRWTPRRTAAPVPRASSRMMQTHARGQSTS